MATADEIRRRIEEADTARSAKRSTAAQQVGELAQRRAAIADQLADIERQLGDVLAAASDVMDIDELARFTDVPATDLTRWLAARKTTRSKHKKPAASTQSVDSDTSRRPAFAVSPTASRPPASPELGRPRVRTTDERVPVEVP
jgi:phage antirepressor YoqD-like protein